ncbi:tetratricopeptide repeat protein [Tenacibaculum ovolyticum]|uniref:tetratricopeptide repeat protein n=1 Tax=Tenacibaculum ovolyticum TaxID=104270 RepID=UPI0022F3A5D6|nr:tetratricopeptide repeat protein [Tenacibaculum ovolyticum]WBX78123.1 tetratricopeptide repeat protein [Tenacibaculum ovolyticum]
MKITLKHILLIFFFSLVGTVFSQNSKIDRLKIELQNHRLNDTTKVNLLNGLAFSYFSKDISKSIEYLDKANALADSIYFKKGKGRSIYIRGITESIKADYNQACSYYNKALNLYESINFKQGIANCYNAMGITYKNKGDLRKSVSYFKKAIQLEEDIKGKNLSAALINLGAVYQDLGDLNKAIPPLKKALSIAKSDKNEQRVAYSLNNLGAIYKEQGNYQLALVNLKKSLYLNEKLGDSISVAHGLFNMGGIYKIQKYYGKAMISYKKSLELYQRIDSKKGISSVLNDIGMLHKENRDYRSALDNYIEAFKMSTQIGAKADIPYILNNIGEVHLALKDYKKANQYFNDSKKNSIEVESKRALCGAYIGLSRTYISYREYDNALSNALKANEISKEIGFLDYQKEASEILFKVYKYIGNYKKSLENHQQFKKLNDSLFNKENIEKLTQLEYEYKYKQVLDSANIRELQLTKTVTVTNKNLEKSQQNLLLGVIAFLVITLILAAIIFFLKLRNEKSKTQNVIIEQKLLRSQMTPHFIFNSLSVLQGMILNKEENNAVSYLSKFSKLLRTILENSRHKTVVLSEELSAINSYMALQNLDMNPPFEYTLNVDSNINETIFKIPPMLIQPFIENAIEHAFPDKKEHKKINVTLIFKEEKLICIIKDNGIGIDEIKQKLEKNKNSLATTITSERLAMLSKEFKTVGTIKVQNRKILGEEGTLVTLMIPYKIELV